MPTEKIGLALSGGGIRASLFSLGVLTALVDAGANRRVTNVSSVSGGSIVNAAVAQSCDYRAATPDQFAKIVEPIAAVLCRRGMFVFSLALSKAGLAVFARSMGRQLLVIAACVAACFLAIGYLGIEDRWWAGALLGVVALVAVVLRRGVAQEALYSLVLGQMERSCQEDGSAGRRDGWAHQRSGVNHVLVATDLVSGTPVYFGRDFALCSAFGWAPTPPTRVAAVVYASAAFPGVFPPKRFNRKQFQFQGGACSPPFPRTLKLSDGGVHNNLGTGWFDVLAEQWTSTQWRFGGLQLDSPPEPVDRLIVVNAGAASRGVRRVWPGLTLSRIMSVLYDNTVAPRLRELKDRSDRRGYIAPFVIDISESPYRIAKRHEKVALTKLTDPVERRCRTEWIERAGPIAQRLEELRGEDFWVDFARHTATTKTKLTKAGIESGARMMYHGYLSTLVVLRIIYGDDAPAVTDFKDEGWFLDLARSGKPSRSGRAERVEQDLRRLDLPRPVGGDADVDRAGGDDPLRGIA